MIRQLVTFKRFKVVFKSAWEQTCVPVGNEVSNCYTMSWVQAQADLKTT